MSAIGIASKPVIDILMATHNGERFIAEQLESLLWQDFHDWRLLVSDDCSTDCTLDVVRTYAVRDSRVQIVSENKRHGSAKKNFVSMLPLVEAPYIMFCDQDDVWLSDKVSATLEMMRELEEQHGASIPLLVFTDMAVVDQELSMISESFFSHERIDPRRLRFQQLVAQNVCAGCTMMVNAEAVMLIERKATDQIVMHDWWLMLVASAFGAIGCIRKPTSLYRQHGLNAVGSKGYAPLERATHLSAMRQSVLDTQRQARAFLRYYRNMMRCDQIRSVEEFLASGKGRGARTVWHLCRSGCWKKGLRKVGQVAVAAVGVEQ